ncbi:MAG: YHS domain-containing protein [Chitinivibrionales bacterium]|nr:YHS domain-containing protein [Chitinivibrionales bacterium]
MGGAINKDVYADHNGHRVYFCCGACKREFKKDPSTYLKKLEELGETPEPI